MNVLILCDGKITRLARIRRVLLIFQEIGAKVTSLSNQYSNDFEFEKQMLVPNGSLFLVNRLIRFFLRLVRWLFPIWGFQKFVTKLMNGIRIDLIKTKTEWDIIYVAHIDYLALAVDVKKRFGGIIIFDVRDYYPREFEMYFMFRWLEAGYRKNVFKNNLRSCDEIITVSNGLVKGLNKEYGVEARLIRSLPKYDSIKPSEVESECIKLVHHGAANRDRSLTKMIDFFNGLDKKFTLDLYLVGNESDIVNLKKYSQTNDRIRFNDPVHIDNLSDELNKYDVGLLFFKPTTFNLRNCLPNKLFEMIQAKLMILTTPIDGISEVVNNFQCGIVLPSFSLSESISIVNTIDKNVVYKFKKATVSASEQLCFEKEKFKYYDLFQYLNVSKIAEAK